jgi:hypothetical protein
MNRETGFWVVAAGFMVGYIHVSHRFCYPKGMARVLPQFERRHEAEE